jgi:hypothetical protein
VKIRAGDSLKRFGVANCEQIVLYDIWRDVDIGGEVEMHQKWQEFIELKQVW